MRDAEDAELRRRCSGWVGRKFYERLHNVMMNTIFKKFSDVENVPVWAF